MPTMKRSVTRAATSATWLSADLHLDPGAGGIGDLQLHRRIAGQRHRLPTATAAARRGQPGAVDDLRIGQTLQAGTNHVALGIDVVGFLAADVAVACPVPACLVEHGGAPPLPMALRQKALGRQHRTPALFGRRLTQVARCTSVSAGSRKKRKGFSTSQTIVGWADADPPNARIRKSPAKAFRQTSTRIRRLLFCPPGPTRRAASQSAKQMGSSNPANSGKGRNAHFLAQQRTARPLENPQIRLDQGQRKERDAERPRQGGRELPRHVQIAANLGRTNAEQRLYPGICSIREQVLCGQAG